MHKKMIGLIMCIFLLTGMTLSNRSCVKTEETAEAQHTIILAREGLSDYTICIEPNSDPMTMHAALELAKYLKMLTGTEFNLSADNTLPSGPLIIVGRGALASRIFSEYLYTADKDDGFEIQSLKEHILIAGKEPRGTLYGVYYFLDRMCGIRWYSPDYTYIPQSTVLEFKALNTVQSPRFEYREMFVSKAFDEQYLAHNLINGKSHYRLNNKSTPELNSWSDFWPEGTHTFWKHVLDSRYYSGGQLAAMEEGTRQAAAESIISKLRKRIANGSPPYLDFSQMDRKWSPVDNESKAFAAAHGGSLSAPILDMVIDVGERVRKVIPDARIGTLAYQFSFTPPTGMTVPDYVIMTLAPIEANFSQPLNGPKNSKIAKDIEGWSSISNNILIWDYLTNFKGYIQPYPNLYQMGETIKFLAKLPSIKGYFGQMTHNAEGGGNGFDELRVWVMSRLLWEPDLDIKGLIIEFAGSYYGEAAPFILQYIELMQQSLADSGSKLLIITPITSSYLSFDVMRQADELLEKAILAVSGQETHSKHVKKVRIGIDYVVLMRQKEFIKEAEDKNIKMNLQLNERLNRFKADIKEAGLGTEVGHGDEAGTFKEYKTLFKELEQLTDKYGKRSAK